MVQDAATSAGNETPLLPGDNIGGYNSVEVVSNDNDDAISDASDFDEEHGTTPTEAFLNLLKGYFGAGMLSLPWALSQLGVVYGSIAVFVMAFWSSYNCWTVVKLKRFIERNQTYNLNLAGGDAGSIKSSPHSTTGSAASSATTRTNLTFPDVGEWAYGTKFQSYVSICVCTQQLAICTVFISFIGENLLAVLDRLELTGFIDSHIGVMTLCLPCVLSLSFLPSMKSLAPVMALGTILLGLCVALLGVIMGKEWDARPEELPELKLPQMPLAACAILYSYEGICLILPIESSMKEPQHFQKVFVGTMTVVATILAAFATICVVTFGNVTNGSITAFLLEAYRKDPSVTFYLMAANTAVSFSVLLSYPLQLFPALELIGTTPLARWLGGIGKGPQDDDDEEDLTGFEPLPPLPEGEVADLDSLPSEHQYGLESDNNEGGNEKNDDEEDARSLLSHSTLRSVTSALMPQMVMPGDSIQLRAFLVVMTYVIAVAVPNVQALISLVGALAGSSTALLIPPILELAWIQTLEEHRNTKNNTTPTDEQDAAGASSLGSPFTPRRIQKEPFAWCGGKYWGSKIKCYILFAVGLVFACIGTFASLTDIIRIYRG
ncbi:Proton-coupled amino acid transporter 4 [Seminavis robusta]|uniref:Proton-coupled amino acid transporter 4 n=1 Tax=Seminavis robusta TaxID=568900 RepID=A0A9N8DNN4_9STRA|nr:Proton-coupled amino acid transporter 4 [Seminavis robusta]|eukprot:Sro239_g095850.1 Proton-coupled amino acid transporter 4 (606) ;mRNA; f:31435-33380